MRILILGAGEVLHQVGPSDNFGWMPWHGQLVAWRAAGSGWRR